MALTGAMRRLLGRRPPPSPPDLAVSGAMLTHPGLVRPGNEDAVAYVLPRPGEAAAARGALALVADGMGGHAAGELASAIAAETVRRLYYELDGKVPQVLAQCLRAANRAIRAHAAGAPDCAGMGTTCTVLAIRGNAAWLGHVGDSRAYLLRGGALRQLSEDHSLVAALVREGRLTPAEAASSPDRNVILRALGTHDEVEPQIWPQGMALAAGDVLVLCSDGLSDLVDTEGIAAAAALPPHEACQTLLQAALAGGAHDNVSVGVFALTAPAPAAADGGPPTRPVMLAAAAESAP